jgi:hypothetical protein
MSAFETFRDRLAEAQRRGDWDEVELLLCLEHDRQIAKRRADLAESARKQLEEERQSRLRRAAAIQELADLDPTQRPVSGYRRRGSANIDRLPIIKPKKSRRELTDRWVFGLGHDCHSIGIPYPAHSDADYHVNLPDWVMQRIEFEADHGVYADDRMADMPHYQDRRTKAFRRRADHIQP